MACSANDQFFAALYGQQAVVHRPACERSQETTPAPQTQPPPPPCCPYDPFDLSGPKPKAKNIAKAARRRAKLDTHQRLQIEASIAAEQSASNTARLSHPNSG